MSDFYTWKNLSICNLTKNATNVSGMFPVTFSSVSYKKTCTSVLPGMTGVPHKQGMGTPNCWDTLPSALATPTSPVPSVTCLCFWQEIGTVVWLKKSFDGSIKNWKFFSVAQVMLGQDGHYWNTTQRLITDCRRMEDWGFGPLLEKTCKILNGQFEDGKNGQNLQANTFLTLAYLCKWTHKRSLRKEQVASEVKPDWHSARDDVCLYARCEATSDNRKVFNHICACIAYISAECARQMRDKWKYLCACDFLFKFVLFFIFSS